MEWGTLRVIFNQVEEDRPWMCVGEREWDQGWVVGGGEGTGDRKKTGGGLARARNQHLYPGQVSPGIQDGQQPVGNRTIRDVPSPTLRTRRQHINSPLCHQESRSSQHTHNHHNKANTATICKGIGLGCPSSATRHTTRVLGSSSHHLSPLPMLPHCLIPTPAYQFRPDAL